MKKNKLLFSIFFVCTVCNFLVAQASENLDENLDEISLPEVSTVVSGGVPKVGKSAVPDFTQILPSDAEGRADSIVPQFPKLSVSEKDSTDVDAVKNAVETKDVYVEGLAGGGFPGFYIGDFSIYRQSGMNPFKISFSHKSSNGFAGNSLTDGFFQKNTEIGAQKTFSDKTKKLDLSANYSSFNDGLQSNVSSISDVSKEELDVKVAYSHDFKNNLYLIADFGGDWYNRFACIVDKNENQIEPFEKYISVLHFSPKVDFYWANQNLKLGLSAAGGFQVDANDSVGGEKAASRGSASLDFLWTYNFLKLNANLGVVFGNQIGYMPVIVPFSLGMNLSFPTSLSSRKVYLELLGGCRSEESLVSTLEKKYRFSVFSELPAETSDWFASVSFMLPIKDIFTLNFNSDFLKTAFGNGNWIPNYNDESTLRFGQYVCKNEETAQFNTKLDFSAKFKIANISASWKSFWIDVPACEVKNSIVASINVQSESARWGANGSFAMALASGEDFTPDIELSAFVRLSSAVRLAVSATDIVKLLSGKERVYAGKYIEQSGSVCVFAKFFF